MLLNLITFFPEFSLIASLLVMLGVKKYRVSSTPRTYFTVSRVFLLLSALFTIILYNRSGFPDYYENSRYTSLFKVLVYLSALIWFYLSNKWFLNEGSPSYRFYSLAVASVLCLVIIISARNFGILVASLALNTLLVNRLVLLRLDNPDIPAIGRRYLIFSAFFILLMSIAAGIFYNAAGTLNYYRICAHLFSGRDLSVLTVVAVGLILSGILYFMAVAPFHFWFLDVVKASILPVGGYLTLVPLLALFACLSDLVINVFFPVYPHFLNVMVIFSVLSLFMGAVGANGEKNILRLFAYASVFNIGFIMINLVSFNANSLFSSFVYLLVYIMAMFGIYTSFLGLKSKGLYVFELREIAGLAKAKPYLGAAMLLFLVSLIGSPPMLGFLGKLSIINNLVMESHYYLVIATLLSLLLIANAYLIVIKTLYFDHSALNFDRIDKSIYICLSINIILVVISILQPRFIMSGFERMLITIF